MTPNYVAKKSIAASLSFWLILFFWLVIPLIIQISRILKAASYSIEFYDNKIVTKSGVLNKNENQCVFSRVYSVSLYRTFFGRILNYGNVKVDCPGVWDIDTTEIKNPLELKKFLEGYISNDNVVNIVNN